ncbi:hypothetical protein ACL9RF_14825 [Sphingobacterium sp. Mn56C]|uniref:hypothetical protein n=1 Tax=Sphingobacterium sp. Mn56C TaxID=3395261 RepID=UPI003BC19262
MKYVFFMLFNLLFGIAVYAQYNAGLPAPDYKFLGKPAERAVTGVSVDKYSGRLLVSMPLTQLTSRSFTIPVGLNYIGGGGLRHQEYASCVGLGWQLAAGGAISRVVRGLPDDDLNGYLGPKQHGKTISNAIRNSMPLQLDYLNTFRGFEALPQNSYLRAK